MAFSRPSGSRRWDSTGVAPIASILALDSSDRANAETSRPSLTSPSRSALPRTPVPPVTNVRSAMTMHPQRSRPETVNRCEKRLRYSIPDITVIPAAINMAHSSRSSGPTSTGQRMIANHGYKAARDVQLVSWRVEKAPQGCDGSPSTRQLAVEQGPQSRDHEES